MIRYTTHPPSYAPHRLRIDPEWHGPFHRGLITMSVSQLKVMGLQMVPRGWWRMGLLEDLKYYKPFSS